jgi:hypothetical protein
MLAAPEKANNMGPDADRLPPSMPACRPRANAMIKTPKTTTLMFWMTATGESAVASSLINCLE